MELLVALAWKSALCAGSTLVLLRGLGRRSAAEQALVARLGLLALVLLPLATLFIPSLRLQAPAPVAGALTGLARAPVEASAVAAAPVASSGGVDWSTIILSYYLVPAAILLAILLVALFRLQRVRRGAEVLVEPHWLTALARAQRRIGYNKGTALLVSRAVNSPVSWGILRPVIILDPAAAGDAAHAEAIVAHELAHVVRMDWLTLLLGRVATALFWFNPLVWMLARRCHQLCEEAADDAVLCGDVAGTDYADLLVGAVRHANRGALLAANGVAPGASSLARRVARVLDEGRARSPARLGWAAGSLAVTLAWTGALAAAEPGFAVPLPRFSDRAGMEAATALDAIDSPQTHRLAAALRSGDWQARRSEGGTLFDRPEAVRPLVVALADPRPEVRRIAVWGLSEMRPARPEAAGPVGALLADPSPEVRAEAAGALGDLGVVGRAEDIARLLADSDAGVRLEAAHALGDLQSPATRPALEAALKDSDRRVAAEAGWALRQVADAEAVLQRYGR